VVRIGREIAEGLAAAHGRGLIHRDVKPANVWLEKQEGGPDGPTACPRVKILDFGLARSSQADVRLTETSAILGTPGYMAPEQYLAAGEVDARADLFSLGCVLYRLATGCLPFTGQTVFEILSNTANRQPAPPRALAPHLPPELDSLVLRLLAKAPTDRPGSAREVADLLRAIEKDLADPGKTPAPGKTLGRLPDERNEGERTIVGLDPGIAPTPRRRLQHRWTWGVAAVLIALVPLGYLRYLIIPPGNGPPLHLTEDGKATVAMPPVVAVVPRAQYPWMPAETEVVLGDLRWRWIPSSDGDSPAVVPHFAFGPDDKDLHVVVCRHDRVLTWDPATFQRVKEIQVPRMASAAVSTDGRLAATLEVQGETWKWKVWEVPSLKQWGRALTSVGKVHTHLAFDPKGKRVVTSGLYSCTLWDLATGDCLQDDIPLSAPSEPVLALSPDGKLLALGEKHHPADPKKVVRLWDVAARKELKPLQDEAVKHVGRLQFFPDGKILLGLVANKEGQVELRVWDVEKRGKARVVSGLAVRRFALSPDGKTLALSQVGGTIEILDFQSGEKQRTLHIPNSNADYFDLESLAFSPDGRTLASAEPDGALRVWDVAGGEQIHGPGERLGLLAVSPDGKSLAITQRRRGRLMVIDPATGKVKKDLDLPKEEEAASALFAADGKTLVARCEGSGKSWYRLWDLTTGEEHEPIERSGGGFRLAPDGKTLFQYPGSVPQKSQLWDTITGKIRVTLEGKKQVVADAAFSPDGRTLATCEGTEVVLWDAATGKEKARLPGSDQRLVRLAFGDDGKRLASVSVNGEAALWDVPAGKLLFRTPGNPLTGLTELTAWSARGWTCYRTVLRVADRTVLVGDSSGRLTRWSSATEAQEGRLPGGLVPIAVSGDGRLFAGYGDEAVVVLPLEALFKR
jgi:WD40 repeat protein